LASFYFFIVLVCRKKSSQQSIVLTLNYKKLIFFRLLTLKILSIVFLITALSHGQKKADTDTRAYYDWFDGQTGVRNKQIYNGAAYVEKYRTINEKYKFFTSSEFLNGSVVFDGQPFYELRLKYDLYEDQLLLNSKGAIGTVIKLNSDKVSSFTIGFHKFINPQQKNQSAAEVSGFYEVLLKTSYFTLLKKNRKALLKKIKGDLVYYEFKKDDENFLFYKNAYYTLNKKRDLLRLFPEFKKNINSYYKTSRNTFATDTFIKALLRNIEQELFNQKIEPAE